MKTMGKDGLLKYKTKEDLFKVCRIYPPRFKGKPVIETIAEDAGFNVVWLPPYHPIFNPIEEAWGVTKGYVADENDGKNFNHVKDLILQGFAKVTAEMWEKLVRRAHQREQDMVDLLKIVYRKEEEEKPGDLDRYIFELDNDEYDEQCLGGGGGGGAGTKSK